MKHLMIIIFTFIISIAAVNASLCIHQSDDFTVLSSESSLDKTDSSELTDSYEEPYLFCITSSYILFFKVFSTQSDLIHYPYEKIFTLLKPPDSLLLT